MQKLLNVHSKSIGILFFGILILTLFGLNPHDSGNNRGLRNGNSRLKIAALASFDYIYLSKYETSFWADRNTNSDSCPNSYHAGFLEVKELEKQSIVQHFPVSKSGRSKVRHTPSSLSVSVVQSFCRNIPLSQLQTVVLLN